MPDDISENNPPQSSAIFRNFRKISKIPRLPDISKMTQKTNVPGRRQAAPTSAQESGQSVECP